MEWYFLLLLLIGGFVFLMFLGIPVVYSFFTINILWMFFFMGGEAGLKQLVLSVYGSLSIFVLLPVTLFILMGELLFRSGVAMLMIDALDRIMGKMPGRISLLTVVSGTLMSALSGASMGTTAMLGASLLPEMKRRGYKTPMSIGPILGSGGLAMLIPPSGLGVILAVVALVSVGDLLVAIVIPGLLLALMYGLYVVLRSWIQPSLAPPYNVTHISFSEKVKLFLIYILPLGSIVFLVVGLIFLGVATPTESAALGALGSFMLAICYKKLNWQAIKTAFESTVRISAMVLIIISASQAYSQILAFSGATRGLVEWTLDLNLTPVAAIIVMQIVILIMGGFIGPTSLIMITIPVFMPVVRSLGLDPMWFAVMTLLSLEMAQTTPPYGMLLFVMKGVAPKETTMWEIMSAAIPFLLLDAILLGILIVFPELILWLPSLMQ